MRNLKEISERVALAIGKAIDNAEQPSGISVLETINGTKDLVAIPAETLTFLMARYMQSLGGVQTTEERTARITHQLGSARNHQEINDILREELEGASIQAFVQRGE